MVKAGYNRNFLRKISKKSEKCIDILSKEVYNMLSRPERRLPRENQL